MPRGVPTTRQGSHVCPRCGQNRHLSSYSVSRPTQGWIAEDGSYRYSNCKYCQRERSKRFYSNEEKRQHRKEYMRAYYASRKNDPEFMAKRNAHRRSEEYRAKRRERERKRRERVKRNATLLAQEREKKRLYAWDARRRRGAREIGPRHIVAEVESQYDLRVDRQPFVKWLERKEREYGSWEVVAEVTGIPERTISRIRNGDDNQERVSLNTVDTALTNEGSSLMWDLYPHLCEVAA